MIMPFGKFKGEEIVNIDSGYLQWLLDNTDVREPLKAAVEAELDAREWDQSPEPLVSTGLTTDLLGEWYRKLSLEFHPDRRGGNHDGQKAINRAREVLVLMLEKVA